MNLNVVLETYEQALIFLDAGPTTEDEHIQALFTVKVRVTSTSLYLLLRTDHLTKDQRQQKRGRSGSKSCFNYCKASQKSFSNVLD